MIRRQEVPQLGALLIVAFCIMISVMAGLYFYVSKAPIGGDGIDAVATGAPTSTVDVTGAPVVGGEANFPESATPAQRPEATLAANSSPQPLVTEVVDNVSPIPWVEQQLAAMTLQQKVGQMIMSGVNGSSLTPETCAYIQRVSPGGIVLLGSNISEPVPQQPAAFTSALQKCAQDANGLPLIIAIDHEGPYVNRFPDNSVMTIFPTAMAQGALSSPQMVYLASYAAGLELRANGINTVLGPVADVLSNKDNTVISTRSFGDTPTAVSGNVIASVRGYNDAGVMSVLKHFPGHGGVSADSHVALPVDDADLPLLTNAYLPPFRDGMSAGAAAVMLGHVAYPQLTGDYLPASLSPWFYELLVGQEKFSGFSLSDAMSMGAISSLNLSVAEASVRAIQAGLDMILVVSPEAAEGTWQQIVLTVERGEISEERINQAVGRILTQKYLHGLADFSAGEPPQVDWESDKSLAYTMGYYAVSVFRDDAGLIPIPDSAQSLLIVGPTGGWGLYPRLQNVLSSAGKRYDILNYSGYWFGPVPETGYLQTAPQMAGSYDLVILFTWDAHVNRLVYGDTFQIQLARTLLERNVPLIIIALKSPTDILEFPGAPAYIASMGTTSGQLQAIADILVGVSDGAGQIPLDIP